MRRRRFEGASQPSISEAVETDYASPSSVVPEHHYSDQDQLEHDDISEQLPRGSEHLSILKSFKNHVAFAIWAGKVSYIKFFLYFN